MIWCLMLFGRKWSKERDYLTKKLPPHIRDKANQCIINQRALIHQRALLYESARRVSFSFWFLPLVALWQKSIDWWNKKDIIFQKCCTLAFISKKGRFFEILRRNVAEDALMFFFKKIKHTIRNMKKKNWFSRPGSRFFRTTWGTNLRLRAR